MKPRKTAALLLSVLLLATLLPPIAARAADPEKTVRVGWYDSSYNTLDQFGRRSGYAYEYQLKLSAYTGWSYEYVTGSWSDLLQMLIDGKIDLMSDVSYTPERAELMLFPELPMGAEDYYLFIAPNNTDISSTDTATLNGKRVGANRDSIQVQFYRQWAERNGVTAELIELNTSENESLQMLEDGLLDAYVTVDSFTNPDRAAPVFKVGSSDFFFAVSKERPELCTALNGAMNRIYEENHYYNQQMVQRYIKTAGANAFLTAEELNWLAQHGTIRVGYQDNYLAFCAKDKLTGELTGAMKDYLNYARDCMANAHIDFEAAAYPTVEAALDDLREGKLDCVFPANLSGYDGEKLGIVMTPPLMTADIFAVVRHADLTNFTNREHVIVAVNQDNPNYDAFLLDHYPNWRTVYYENTDACLKAVSEGVADCVLISSYRYNNISRLCNRYRLTTFPTALGLDYCFAVDKGQTEMYAILSKVISQVPSSAVNSALSYYITEDARLSFGDFIADNLPAFLFGLTAVMLVIVLIMLRSMRAERRAKALIEATEADPLTGLYNRDYFLQYVNRMRAEQPDQPMDAIVLNIEQFHSVNALNGRDFGDRALRALGNELRTIARETGGIAGRFGADRFYLFCRHLDDYQDIYDRLQRALRVLTPNASLRLRMGVMPWQSGLKTVEMFDRARTACNSGRGQQMQLIIFDNEAREQELFQQRLLGDLPRALASYEFEVYYQPKFDIRKEPPELVSAEALIRWQHPELGLLSPGAFIPLFEGNGQIGELDRYVWAEAARQVARWRAQFGVTLPVSVNLSRADVFDPSLMDTLDGILTQNGLPRDVLKLEVTESACTEHPEQVIRVVEALHSKGYIIEMDDFGVGYSSLNTLSTIPIDVLKMDRMFIMNIDTDEKDAQLVALILGIARSLGVPVIAEGVETEAQLQVLKKLDCAVVQGFYFSRPLHPSDFEAKYFRNHGR